MILVYGNCQIGQLFTLLLHSESFRKKYNINNVPKESLVFANIFTDSFYRILNYDVIKKKKNIINIFDKKYDLVILQYTKSEHGIYSTDYIKNKLNCDNIIILPFVVNHGIFAISREGNLENQMYKSNNKTLELLNGEMGSQEIIDLFYKYDLKTVLRMLKNLEINFNIQNRFNKCIKILQDKEKHCNYTVSDIIINNKSRLCDQNVHITEYLIQLIANKILKNLQLEPINIYNANYKQTVKYDFLLKFQLTPPVPLSPYEIKFLNMDEESDENWLEYYNKKITEIYNGFIN